MKIQIISDLHLEFLSSSQINKMIDRIHVYGDVLVLAGDIGNGVSTHYKYFLEKIAQKFIKVFLVAGNHEYYGNDISITNQTIQSVCDNLDNVSFLCSSWEDYNGFRWIGTTLWSQVDVLSTCSTNDIRYIKNMPIQTYNERHSEAVNFLRNTLQDANDTPCIVITHYIPSMELIHPKYKTQTENPYNQWFASSLDSLIKQHTTHTPLWIYGHTHDFSHVRMFQTEMVCNPYGYKGENTNPKLDFTITL